MRCGSLLLLLLLLLPLLALLLLLQRRLAEKLSDCLFCCALILGPCIDTQRLRPSCRRRLARAVAISVTVAVSPCLPCALTNH